MDSKIVFIILASFLTNANLHKLHHKSLIVYEVFRPIVKILAARKSEALYLNFDENMSHVKNGI